MESEKQAKILKERGDGGIKKEAEKVKERRGRRAEGRKISKGNIYFI